MESLEIRIQATNTHPYRGDFNESKSYYIEVPMPVTTVGIMKALRESNAIQEYIKENDIPAVMKENPTRCSSLNEHCEFGFSLPSTVVADQSFVIRIINPE